MSCSCSGENQTLLGALSLPPVKKDARFQFGYNVGYLASGFVASGVGDALNASGITYDTTSYQLAGTLNPYMAIDGKSNRDWNSGSDLRDAIYNVINGAGYPIEPNSIGFNVETVSGGYTLPPVSTTQPPGSAGSGTVPGAGIFDEIGSSLGLTGETSKMVVIGAGVLVAILLLKR